MSYAHVSHASPERKKESVLMYESLIKIRTDVVATVLLASYALFTICLPIAISSSSESSSTLGLGPFCKANEEGAKKISKRARKEREREISTRKGH